jgi:hypothetical protein
MRFDGQERVWTGVQPRTCNRGVTGAAFAAIFSLQSRIWSSIAMSRVAALTSSGRTTARMNCP